MKRTKRTKLPKRCKFVSLRGCIICVKHWTHDRLKDCK